MPKSDFFSNIGGLNVTDSPFFAQDSQATGGWNFEYPVTGGISKSRDKTLINTNANSQLTSLGLGAYVTSQGVRTEIRVAGTKYQTVDLDTGIFTAISDDTQIGGTTPFSGISTQPAFFSQFNNGLTDINWCLGAGLSTPLGFNGTKITVNGTPSPTGTFTAAVSASGLGSFSTTGTLYYAVALRKKSTQSISNAALDQIATIAHTTDTVLLTLPTGLDTTLYDQWYIYKSSFGGVSAFTTGDLVATIPTTQTTYKDFGNVVFASAVAVPRAGNTTDNSILPTFTPSISTLSFSADFVSGNTIAFTVNGTSYSVPFTTDNATTLKLILTTILGNSFVSVNSSINGSHAITVVGNSATNVSVTGISVTGGISQATSTYNTTQAAVSLSSYSAMAVFKRRLVVASGNSFYLSDINKSESWPTPNAITLPYGGNITAIGVLSFNKPAAASIDEIMLVLTQTHCFVFTGNNTTDWALRFLDFVGCAGQTLLVTVNQLLAWIDYRGIYVWSGSSKPIYCSRLIEAMFAPEGTIQKASLSRGIGVYYRKQNIIHWQLTDGIYGLNKFSLRMDLRLSDGALHQEGDQAVTQAIFHQGSSSEALFALNSTLDSGNNEMLIVGDDRGYLYKHYTSFSDNGANYLFQYDTRHLDLGNISIAKRYKKVIAWVSEIAATDVQLQYWADYRVNMSNYSSVTQNVAPQNASASLWDLMIWDVSYWDDYSATVKPLVFNLHSDENNAEGDSIKLRFIQNNANVPFVLHGFSIIWEELSLRH